MGPIGLLLYVMADKEPAPGSHEGFIKPLWKQGVGSTVHCVAGDATGIILAAVAVALLGFPMWIDLVIEYLAGFLFGLLIFQALFMRKVMGGTYTDNVRRSFLPELMSMNCMMGGMARVMVLVMMGRDMRAMWPGEPLFWMVMSLGVIAGFAIAYPVNVWLVSHGLKHGLMTERTGDASSHRGHDEMAAADHGSVAGASRMPADVTRAQLIAVTLFSLLVLTAGMTVPSAFVNLRLTAHEVRGAIMPPGMIMTEETSAAAMLDMAAVDPRDVTATYDLNTQGAQLLAPRLEDGVKVFDLETSIIRLRTLPTVSATAYACNGQVPGPTLRFRQGDRVRINVTNRLPDTTTGHWHGLVLPHVMDGAEEITQSPIVPVLV